MIEIKKNFFFKLNLELKMRLNEAGKNWSTGAPAAIDRGTAETPRVIKNCKEDTELHKEYRERYANNIRAKFAEKFRTKGRNIITGRVA